MTDQQKQKKRGNKAGFLFFQYTTRIFGLSGAYKVLFFVCLYYLIFDRDAVKKAEYYIKRRFPNCSIIKRYFHIYILFINQGKQLIDRYAHRKAPDLFKMSIEGTEQTISTVKNLNSGCIILTSHIGNWQLGMDALQHLNYKKLHMLMRPEDNKAVQETLALNPSIDMEFISTSGFLGGTIDVLKALENGDIVSIMGDRSYGTQTVDISFLGEKAYFPYSAFFFAASANCPIVTLYVVKEDKKNYKVYMNKFLYPKLKHKAGKKAEQLRPWVQEFANELESFTKKYPYQCFLFNNVWSTDSN
jgi:predicted LPLAT superfamily acyltransferase